MYFPSGRALRGAGRVLGVCALTALAVLTFAVSTSAAKTSTAVGYVTDFGTGSNDTSGIGSGSSIFVNALTGSPPGGTYTTADSTKTVSVADVSVSAIDSLGVKALEPFDTVILYQICDIATHPATVTAINQFLADGGKVMLFDADRCAPGFADYSSFLFPFTVSRPGLVFEAGSYTSIVASTLTSGLAVGNQEGDAVLDANFFESFSGAWCASITAGKFNAKGFVEATAQTPKGGLVIYEGEDFWFTEGLTPHLRLVFDDVLKQDWAPAGLPCSIPASGISLGPPSQTHLTGTTVTVTTKVVDIEGNPLEGVGVEFEVESGPNKGTTGKATTDTFGEASFSYTGGPSTGTDNVLAGFVDSLNNKHTSNTVEVIWEDAPITATGQNLSGTEGAVSSGTVATFTDPDKSATASEYSAMIEWGDGSSSTGTVTGSGGSFSVSGNHTYAEEGNYKVKMAITDVDNASNGAKTTSEATVADAALASKCAALATNVQAFAGPTATFTDADPGGMSSDYTAQINWGDGNESAGAISADTGPGPYTVSGSHAYGSTGTFTITTTIKDAGGSETVATCTTQVFGDPSGPAFQILAPGEGGFPAPDRAPGSIDDQAQLYDELTPLGGNVTTKNLEELYLSEKFGAGVGPGEAIAADSPKPGLVIERDKNYIPHVYGATRSQVMFGAGWVAAEDRGSLLKRAVGAGYAAALDIPIAGVNPLHILESGPEFTPSAQAVKFVEGQKQSLKDKGPRGEQVLEDLEAWAEGVNAFEEKFKLVLPPQIQVPHLTATDAIAGFALIGSIFGNGGGQEVRNSNFLAGLEAQFGASKGRQVFQDLREVNDPEAPTTAKHPFPYDQVPTGPTPGAAVIDKGSMSPGVAQAASAAVASKRQASNFLLAGPAHSADGHPLAVMGPQLGYYYPEIVMQGELHGGGVDAQGIIGIGPYVFIGRGRDFAWSLTTADNENMQQFLEQLCNTDGTPPTRNSTHYMHNGQCIAMKAFDAGQLGPGNPLQFPETVHGPVSGTVTVGGQPYAVARKRSTRGREPAGELAFSDLDSNRVHNPSEFFEAANELETTFNVAYVDSSQIAYFSTGRLPILAPGTDSSLPTFGTGAFDWRGFIPQEAHPHEVAPKSDTFLNWNNKPAPEWGAASDQFSYGPVHRVQLYTGFKSGMSEADVASIMNRAATQDLQAVKVWPVILQVLEGEPAPSTLAQQAANLVTTWVEHGASRFGIDQPEDPGAAVFDQAWLPIAKAVLEPILGPALLGYFEVVSPPVNPPRPFGGAYYFGWFGYISKDLRTELGLPVDGPFSRRYCGGGSLKICRASLWAAIKKAADELAQKQGSDLSKWRTFPVRIGFPPAPSFPVTMAWTNRSTFQQVIEFTGHGPTQ